MPVKPIDITGNRYGRLTALRFAEAKRNKNGELTHYWWFRCDCGKELIVRKAHAVAGSSKSCGCLSRETAAKLHRTHGETNTKLHNTWFSMIERCENENGSHWENYGGRGIKVCQKWHNYLMFRAWAVNNGFQETLTLDRKDVNGNYEPGNCRWVTMEVQNNNKRNNRFIIFEGERLTATQWAKRLGGHYSLVLQRLGLGWNEAAAVSTPVKCRGVL